MRSLPPRQRQAYQQYLDDGDIEKAKSLLERSPVRQAARSRVAAQEAENVTLMQQGSRSLGDSERALRRSLRSFKGIRIARYSPGGRQLTKKLRGLEDALAAVRSVRRGSLIDADLAIRDRDLEG